jgi:hypothetical protein
MTPSRPRRPLCWKLRPSRSGCWAIEEGREDPETIIAANAAAEAKLAEEGEGLERVVPPPEPFEFQQPVRERDRMPRGER